MLGVFAEFETNLRRERQLEGIAKAKERGVYKGRPASIDATKVRQMHAEGVGPTEIARALKIGRASVYRALGPADCPHGGQGCRTRAGQTVGLMIDADRVGVFSANPPTMVRPPPAFHAPTMRLRRTTDSNARLPSQMFLNVRSPTTVEEKIKGGFPTQGSFRAALALEIRARRPVTVALVFQS